METFIFEGFLKSIPKFLREGNLMKQLLRFSINIIQFFNTRYNENITRLLILNEIIKKEHKNE